MTVFNPEYFGTPLDESYPEGWEYIFYVGVVPTALAACGFAWGRGPHITALRIAVVLSAALAIDRPLLGLVAHIVPGYGVFRLPARILFLTSFLTYCLAGVGIDQLLGRIPARMRRVVAVVLVAGVALEGSYWARRYLSGSDSVPFPADAPYVAALHTPEPARIASLSTATPNYGSAPFLNLQMVTGYDPFIFRHFQNYIDVVQQGRLVREHAIVWSNLDSIARWDLLDALNVAFVVSPAPLATLPTGYVLAQTFQDQLQFRFYEGVVHGPVYVYRNERRLQRAFFVSSVQSVTSEDEMVADVIRRNLREEAVVLGGPGGGSLADPGDRVDVGRAARGVVELTAKNAHRRFLVVSEVWHPGWQATVDGQPATLHRANIALQGLWLEPGTHQVRLGFWPVGLSAGLVVTGVSLVALFTGVGLVLRRWIAFEHVDCRPHVQ